MAEGENNILANIIALANDDEDNDEDDDDVGEINHINDLILVLAEPIGIDLLEGHPRLRRPRNDDFVEVTVPRFSDDLFKEHFRMSRGTFQNLRNILGNNIVHHRDNIDFEKKILFSIWILAKQECFLAAGDRFGLAKSTAHGIFKRTMNALANLIPQYVQFPNAQEMQISSSNFQARSQGFPGVIGAIDGCHIPIKQPVGNARDYYNRNGYHSIILQGTCNHVGKFIDCHIGLPGRMHDANVFRNSPLYRALHDDANPLLDRQFHLIGDSAYPLMPSLMRPFRNNGHLTEEQTRFNVKLSGIRSIIERSFGMLKGKFRRLKYLDVMDMDLANNTIAAACVLHNFLIMENDINMNEEIELEFANEFHEAGDEENIADDGNAATMKRNYITTLL